MDFGIFQDSNTTKLFVSIIDKEAAQEPNVIPSTSAPATAAPNANASAMNATDSIRRIRHANVICDGCECEIFGFRYKCLECADFDLCMDCEDKMHSQHMMVRLTEPSDAEIVYRTKLGRRFMRHRRSEGHKPSGSMQKRSNKRCGVDDISDAIDAFLGIQQPATSPATEPSQTKKAEKSKVSSNGNQANPTAKGPNQTNGTRGSVTFANVSAPTTPRDPFRLGALSNMAQHFATMMDPFAIHGTFQENREKYQTAMDEFSKAYGPYNPMTTSCGFFCRDPSSTVPPTGVTATASASASTSATNSASTSDTSATSTTPVISATTSAATDNIATTSTTTNEATNKADNASATEAARSTQSTEANAESVDSAPMVVDCSDDDDEAVFFRQPNKPKKPSKKSASPPRDWTFVEATDVEEQSSNSSGGAIPKQTPIPDEPAITHVDQTIDFVELARLLRTHIDDGMESQPIPAPQKPADPPKEQHKQPSFESGTVYSSPFLSIELFSDYLSFNYTNLFVCYSGPDVTAPLNTMLAMGFSNDNGWLSQLLQTVDGDIPSALDLLQPHRGT